MKVTENFIVSNYAPLRQKAHYILRGVFNFPAYEIELLAEDITINFLYSKSLRDTYSSSKGAVLPFFASYVRKSVQRLRDNMRKYHVVSFEPWMSKTYDSVLSYDIANWLVSLMRCLQNKLWVSRGKRISYSKLFELVVIQALDGDLWGENVNCTVLAKKLGAARLDVSFALTKMREILNAKRVKGII